MFYGRQILPNMINTIKQHQTSYPNGKMFGHQTMFDGVFGRHTFPVCPGPEREQLVICLQRIMRISAHMLKTLLKVIMLCFFYMIEGSHAPTAQTMFDRITESSVIPPREHNLNPLSARRDFACDETLDGMHIQDDGGVSKKDDDVVRLITAAAERDSQEQIERLQRELQEYEAENQILQAELKGTSLFEDKRMCCENIFQLSSERTADAASRVEKGLPDGAGSLQGERKLSLIRLTL